MKNDTNIVSDSHLSFRISKELFATNVKHVLNILEMVKITKVPKAPGYMTGIINLRGKVLPVIDTRIKLGLNETQITKDTCILVTELQQNDDKIQIGALVDSVQEVIEISQEKILPPPSIGTNYKSDFILGTYEFKDEFIMILDLNKIFDSNEILQLNKAQETIQN